MASFVVLKVCGVSAAGIAVGGKCLEIIAATRSASLESTPHQSQISVAAAAAFAASTAALVVVVLGAREVVAASKHGCEVE